MQTPLILTFDSSTVPGRHEVRVRDFTAALESSAGGYLLVLRGEAAAVQKGGPLDGRAILLTGEALLDGGAGTLGPLLAGHRDETPVLGAIDRPVTWLVPLGYEALDALERHRAGGDLNLRLSVHATLLNPTTGAAAATSKKAAGGELWPTVSAQVPVTIGQSEWVKQLEQVGAAAGVFVVVHPRPHAGGTRYTDSLKSLREARRLFDGGAFRQSVTEVRKALEVLRELEPAPADQAPRKDRDKSEEQRWYELREALWRLVAVAPHGDEVSSSFSWTRQDAQAVLAMAASLLDRFDPR